MSVEKCCEQAPDIPCDKKLMELFQIHRTTGITEDINTFYLGSAEIILNYSDNITDQFQNLALSYREYLSHKFDEKAKKRKTRTGKEIELPLFEFIESKEAIIDRVMSFAGEDLCSKLNWYIDALKESLTSENFDEAKKTMKTIRNVFVPTYTSDEVNQLIG
ncbi:hypothetical protein N9J72_00890 [Candidatus Gracilibacteria bacterium]|nr:hypothetical protein [Candidatus Gracilibacteria bacterium]